MLAKPEYVTLKKTMDRLRVGSTTEIIDPPSIEYVYLLIRRMNEKPGQKKRWECCKRGKTIRVWRSK